MKTLLLLISVIMMLLAVKYTFNYFVRILKLNGINLPSLKDLAKGASYSIFR
jgi:hypothetical protein